ncbi:MAG: PD-(D/E)XK nuclease family protein [Actinomycetota bacterium]|nr:MAG: PD-(D/E)XK nuclease family protein [Actinomycetota bacterium]
MPAAAVSPAATGRRAAGDSPATTGIPVEVATRGEGLPAAVSPSQVTTYLSCPLRYYFATVGRWREPPSPATIAGSLVHDTFEALYREAPADRTRQRAHDLLRAEAAECFSAPENAPYARDPDVADLAKASVDGLFEVEDPTRVAVAATDLAAAVATEVGGVRFAGRLDRRSRGEVDRLTDYKTGQRPAAADLGDALRQLHLSAAALEVTGDPVDEVELLYVAVGTRVRRPVYRAVLDDAVATLSTMRASSAESLQRNTWEARRGPLCRRCAFRRACPVLRHGAPAPGTADSDLLLTGTGLQRRSGPRPEPRQADPATAADHAR